MGSGILGESVCTGDEDALKAAREMEKRWKYHKISATEVETKRKKKSGGGGESQKRRAYPDGLPRKNSACGG